MAGRSATTQVVKEPAEKKIRKWALLIGVGEFKETDILPVNGVTKNLERFDKILNDRQRSDFEVAALENPTFLDGRKAISKISQNANEEDVVFFYYSGYGKMDADKTLYLLFADSDKHFMDATCIESEYILSQFRKSKCRNFIIVVDCSHSGAFFNSYHRLPKGLSALTACAENELAYEDAHGGIFTRIIIEGLTSDYIDANRDGSITFSELFNYVIERTKNDYPAAAVPLKWEWNVARNITFFDSPRLVFLSYKRVQLPFVKKLSEDLRQKGIPTFMDLEKIRIGDDWRDELERTIINSRVFIFVLDKEIIYSEVSMWELETAFKHKVPILPIEVEQVKLPAMFNSFYGHINRLPFYSGDYEDNLVTLVHHIKALRVEKYASNHAESDSINTAESK